MAATITRRPKKGSTPVRRIPARSFATFLCKTFAAEQYAELMAESLAGGEAVNTVAPFIDRTADELRSDPRLQATSRGDITVTEAEWLAYRDFNRAEKAKSLADFEAKYGVPVPTITLGGFQ